jgi:hypothetical protein
MFLNAVLKHGLQILQVKALSADYNLKVEELAVVKVKIATDNASLEASKAAAAAQTQLLTEASASLASKQVLQASLELGLASSS